MLPAAIFFVAQIQLSTPISIESMDGKGKGAEEVGKSAVAGLIGLTERELGISYITGWLQTYTPINSPYYLYSDYLRMSERSCTACADRQGQLPKSVSALCYMIPTSIRPSQFYAQLGGNVERCRRHDANVATVGSRKTVELMAQAFVKPLDPVSWGRL